MWKNIKEHWPLYIFAAVSLVITSFCFDSGYKDSESEYYYDRHEVLERCHDKIEKLEKDIAELNERTDSIIDVLGEDFELQEGYNETLADISGCLYNMACVLEDLHSEIDIEETLKQMEEDLKEISEIISELEDKLNIN